MTSELTTTANLPLQRQRCRRLERFLKVEEIIIFLLQNALGYSWRYKFLQRWGCNSRA
jgi:hypothetical protein